MVPLESCAKDHRSPGRIAVALWAAHLIQQKKKLNYTTQTYVHAKRAKKGCLSLWSGKKGGLGRLSVSQANKAAVIVVFFNSGKF